MHTPIVWQRNIPLGGNHFTKQLSKDMKLTFAKAEHLKRNAMKAENPKVVFQAMRPVFSDLVAEIQRSIGFFSSVNRDASIGRIVGVGNGFKLAGLQKFLQQNLQMEVRWSAGDTNLMQAYATDLVGLLKPDVLLAASTPNLIALQRAVSSVAELAASVPGRVWESVAVCLAACARREAAAFRPREGSDFFPSGKMKTVP